MLRLPRLSPSNAESKPESKPQRQERPPRPPQEQRGGRTARGKTATDPAAVVEADGPVVSIAAIVPTAAIAGKAGDPAEGVRSMVRRRSSSKN